MKLTQLFLCSAALALPLTLHAATQKSDDRWFDVEIILFSQLGDKSQLKESFPDTSELPKHRRIEDLLRWYLNPDIRSLKQLLPRCDSSLNTEKLVNKSAQLPALFNEKSLTEISLLADEYGLLNQSSELEESSYADPTSFSDSTNSTTRAATEIQSAGIKAVTDNAMLNSEVASNPFDNNDLLETTLSDEENAKIQQLVNDAEQAFQAIKFHYTATTESTLICKIDEAYFTDYKTNNPTFDYYGFAVDKMPSLIDGQENLGDSQTHLLSKNSLMLDDVFKDLRYSKNFRPLLHMAWRQVARPEKYSVPVRVYAGENFAADYQKKLNRFNDQQTVQMLDNVSETNSLVTSPALNQIEKDSIDPLQVAKKSHIEQIIAQLSQVSADTDEQLSSLNTQALSLNTANGDPLAVAAKTPPLPPVQQWFLEGFFNIHLKHYLFITADFNILDKNLSELATAQLSDVTAATSSVDTENSTPIQAKAIRFKQNRRVISGEVHYFDHPYMGMIVQIRPYTMSKKKARN
ncbi:MAG: CsiV family protein [Cognaticolwellia sp.]